MQITKDGGFYHVYSALYDYMAYGKTKEEAIQNFNIGLSETLKQRNQIQ